MMLPRSSETVNATRKTKKSIYRSSGKHVLAPISCCGPACQLASFASGGHQVELNRCREGVLTHKAAVLRPMQHDHGSIVNKNIDWPGSIDVAQVQGGLSNRFTNPERPDPLEKFGSAT